MHSHLSPVWLESSTAWSRSNIDHLVPEPTFIYKIRAKKRKFINYVKIQCVTSNRPGAKENMFRILGDLILILGKKCNSCRRLNLIITGQSEIAIHPAVM